MKTVKWSVIIKFILLTIGWILYLSGFEEAMVIVVVIAAATLVEIHSVLSDINDNLKSQRLEMTIDE